MTSRPASRSPTPPPSRLARWRPFLARWKTPVLAGLLPVNRRTVPRDVVAGLTLAALGIPEVLGYARIAGMPVVTGLYTMLLPMVAFALLGSSRHLVVGADSATAAILAAGLAGLAVAGSPEYVSLAGLAALLTGVLLLLARLVGLGFLANFLSRTVLIGFLTGVGIQVAAGQLAQMLGITHPAGHGTLRTLWNVARHTGDISGATVLVAGVVAAVLVMLRLIAPRLPGALLVVAVSIVVSRAVDLPRHGVEVLGPVPRGLPHFALPELSQPAIAGLLGTSVSLFAVVLAQSLATSRVYAGRYDETLSEDADLVGLGAANLAASVTGTFVVNGSPTKTQMVDGAGGRSQLAHLTTSAVALLVLLFLTGPLTSLPLAALATIVFLIGLELVDIDGMRRILAVRPAEFVLALLSAAAVALLGVEQGIIFAIFASVVDHLRHSYAPSNVVLLPTSEHHWTTTEAQPGKRTSAGLVVYRFGSSLYYANVHQLLADVHGFLHDGQPMRVFCLDAAAIGDVDMTAAEGLRRLHALLHEHGVRLVLADVSQPVKAQLDRYGLTSQLRPDAFFRSPADVIAAFRT